jgi:hypothetical protein
VSRTVVVAQDRVLRGASYCYRSHDSALAASRYVTTAPGVIALELPGGEAVYLAAGDYWLGRDGEKGQYAYGRGRKLVDLVERETRYEAPRGDSPKEPTTKRKES